MDIPSDPVPKGFDAANAPNLPDIEKQFAVKCIEQAEAYWKLLGSVSPTSLKLTRHDDAIMESIKEHFPDMAENKNGCLKKLDEDSMKSKEGKEKWRNWIQTWEKIVKDFNFGTLVRTDCGDDYTETNTTFTTRIQFYAIEIARNRNGLNDQAHELAKKEKEDKEQMEKDEEAKKKESQKA